MIVMVVLLGIVLVVLVLRRRGRKTELAGRNVEKPTYTVEAPQRRVGDRRTERL